MTTQQVAGLLDAEGLREQVGEFLDDDRERDFLAARSLEATTIYQERVAGAEQRFEEQVPVEAAAVVFLRLRRGEGVPGRGPRRPREAVVVHADHRDDAERYGAHRLHRADGDGTGVGAITATRQREGLAQHRGDAGGIELERGGASDGCGLVVREQLLQRGRHARALPRTRLGHGAERVDDGLETRTPCAGGGRRRELLLQALQAIADLGQRAEALRVVAARQIDRHRGTETARRRHDGDAAGVRHQHTEREPLEREADGVLVDGGLVVVCAIVRIPSPTQPRGDDEILQHAEIGVIDTELGAHRLATEQFEQAGGRDARTDEPDDIEQHCGDRVGVGETEVGDVHRDGRDSVAILRGAVLAPEHRGDERRVGRKIGRHHKHMARLERRIGDEAAQEVVAQRLALAQRTMTGVDLDGRQRTCVSGKHAARLHALAQTGRFVGGVDPSLQDLQPVRQRLCLDGGIDCVLDALVAEIFQPDLQITARCAVGRELRIAALELLQKSERLGRRFRGTQCGTLVATQTDVSPPLRRGDEHEEMDVHVPSELCDMGLVAVAQRGETEHEERCIDALRRQGA